MRKLFAFLLLFGGGLFVLWKLQNRTGNDASVVLPQEDLTRRGSDKETGRSGVQLGGKFHGVWYGPPLKGSGSGGEERRPTLARIESADSRSFEGEDILSTVVLELFDSKVADGSKQAELFAETAWLARQEGLDDRELRYQNLARLQEVEARFLRDVFLAPLDFSAPRAVLDARDPARRLMQSDERFRIRSQQLDAGGTGIVLHLDEDLLEVLADGWLTFNAAERSDTSGEDPIPGAVERLADRSARLTSGPEGRLQVRREGGNEPRTFVAQAWKGATLEVGGERPAVLEAREVLLRANESEVDGSLILAELEADDQVEVELDENLFQGSHGRLEFGPEGELTRALLSGLPHAVFLLPASEEWPLGTDPSGEAPEKVRVDVSGERTLDAHWGEGLALTMTGPTTLETQGLSLRSVQGLTSSRSADGRRVTFDVAGGVVLETDQGTLETANLDIELDTDVRGQVVFLGRASNGARIVGNLEDGREFTVSTPEGLTVRGSPGAWVVEEGTQIEVSVADPEGSFFRADRVENVQLEDLAFSAFGNVHYRMRRPDRLAILDADAIEVSSSEEKLPSGEHLRRFVFDARGSVEGTIGSPARTDTIRCSDLHGVHVERSLGADGTEIISEFRAQGEVDTDLYLEGGKLRLKSDSAYVRRRQNGEVVLEEELRADGRVHFEGERGFPFQGDGEHLALDGTGGGKLYGDRERVALAGSMPSSGLPFRLTADEVFFDAQNITASEPSLRLAGYRARAHALKADDVSLELSGDVRASGFTPRNAPWTLSTQKLRFEGQAEFDAKGEPVTDETSVSAVYASGGVQFQLEDVLRAEGDSLEAKRIHGNMRLEGSPVRAFTAMGEMETEWIEFSPSLQMITGTGPGKMKPSPEAFTLPAKKANGAGTNGGTNGHGSASAATFQEEPDPGAGTIIEFLSTSTQVDIEKDSIVFLIQEPVFDSPLTGRTLRASWAVLWLDRELWLEVQDDVRGGSGGIVEQLRRSFAEINQEAQKNSPFSKLFDMFQAGPLAGLLREVYLEGPVEFISGGDLLFRSNAAYLDAVSKHGWLANATVNLYGKLLGQSFDKLIVKADWLRLSQDGSLRADDATVTPCNYDEPHIKVVTGDLEIKRKDETEGDETFALTMKKNRVELYDTLRIPLPTIDITTDHEFHPIWKTLSLANSARFGTLLSFGFSRPAGKLGEAADEVFTTDKTKPYDSSIEVEGSYLGSRGGLLDLGLEVSSKQNYYFELYTGVIFDQGEDKGFLRVPAADRDEFRYWIRSFGHFERGDSTLTLTVSNMSDGAVQSEFFERQFLGYERDETYLQWHRSSGEWFSQLALETRLDTFRSEIEELPSVSAFHSRAPIFHVGKQPVHWVGDMRGQYLRRRESNALGADLDGDGNPDPLQSPFGLPATFPDGLGEREILRLDTLQAFEAPMALNTAGLRLTPFVRARGTYWDEGIDPAQAPTRTIAEVGARLATTFWRENSDGTQHQVVPYVGLRSEVFRDDNDAPLVLDEIENQLSGDLIEVGARGRFGLQKGVSLFDLDLNSTYAADRSDGVADGWLPLGVFSRMELVPLGRRFELWHDARYDLENGETAYSLLTIGTRVGERFGMLAGHQRGRNLGGRGLFEAATIEGIFRWSEKWEFEARQAFSLLDDQELDLRVLIRRYGHDVVFDLETSVREGEGSSFGVSLRPRFGYRRPRIGYVPW